MTEVIVALIMGGASIIGVVLSNKNSNRKIEEQLKISQAVTETKLEELTREVREHNEFARRMPVVEAEIKRLRKYHE